jgi:hypothetical protein
MKNIEYILNDCLNKAMCQKGRIQQPDSNKIAEFVSKYVEAKKLNLHAVVLQNEQFSLSDIHKIAQGYTEDKFIEMVKHLQG